MGSVKNSDQDRCPKQPNSRSAVTANQKLRRKGRSQNSSVVTMFRCDHPPVSCDPAWCSDDPPSLDYNRPPVTIHWFLLTASVRCSDLSPTGTFTRSVLEHTGGNFRISSKQKRKKKNRKKEKNALMFSWQRYVNATPPVAAVRTFKAATCSWITSSGPEQEACSCVWSC